MLTPQDAERAVAAAQGRPVWGTRLGVGSFLTLELGAELPASAPTRAGETPRHGEFHVWVYCSAWRIETPQAVLASSEDPRETLAGAVRVLDGKVLAGVRVEPPSLSATFSFVDGTVLRTFSIFSADYEHWMVYLPDGQVVTAGPGPALGLGA
jgi:hypothetical protein